MNVFRGNFTGQLGLTQSVAMTVGNFDGLHIGHCHLLSELKSLSNRGVETLVLSFSPHPSHIVGGQSCDLLFSDKDKLEQLEKLSIYSCVVQDFSSAFAQLTAEDFLRQYLFPVFQPKILLLGHDFSYGRGGEGSFEMAQEIGQEFDCKVLESSPYKDGSKVVSSSAIRTLLKSGDVESANKLLGRLFYKEGLVIKGEALGRTLGFPTANIESTELTPGHGVYAGIAIYKGNSFKAVTNIGRRPTVTDHGGVTVECHLLDFDKIIYGESLKFYFYKKIRDEKKFSGKLELIEQISADIEWAQNALKGSVILES